VWVSRRGRLGLPQPPSTPDLHLVYTLASPLRRDALVELSVAAHNAAAEAARLGPARAPAAAAHLALALAAARRAWGAGSPVAAALRALAADPAYRRLRAAAAAAAAGGRRGGGAAEIGGGAGAAAAKSGGSQVRAETRMPC
jgi:hypothetical protein